MKPGDTAIDIGVNEGTHFHQMIATVHQHGLVIGVEAAPAMVEATKNLLHRAGLSQHRHVLHNVAVADYQGEAQFSFVSGAPGLSSLADREVGHNYAHEKISVKVTTIDDLLSDVRTPIVFSKIDIEGGEYNALKCGTRLFKDGGPIVFEFDHSSPDYFNFTPSDFVRLFEQQNYLIYDFFGNQFESGEALMESLVWNFVATPPAMFERLRIKEVVASSLRSIGVTVE